MIDLKKYKNEKYAIFQAKIIPDTKYEILGIYSADLKKIAKENKNNFEYLKENHYYFEEYMLHALILGYIKDFNYLIDNLSEFIYKIDNWALCDTLCSSLKITKKFKNEMFEFIKKFDNYGYQKRFFLVMLKCYYVEEEYLNYIFLKLNEIKTDEYYVNMAAAWLLSECYIKYHKETYDYLLNSKLNDFAYNKAISKIHDSYRVTKEEKSILEKLRRR